MKKGYIVVGIILLVMVIGVVFGIKKYNKLIDLDTMVENKYADIQVQLERRLDLIPNLVNTVKGYMTHEEKVINSITEAREKLSRANNALEQAKANQELTQALNNLYVIVENYPDLKANQNFIQLQDELAGTENRIAVARTNYNEVVKDYNKTIKKFPTMIIASMFNFNEKEYFIARDGAEDVPEVNFE